jgi:NitT/TauT family transport system permease protein
MQKKSALSLAPPAGLPEGIRRALRRAADNAGAAAAFVALVLVWEFACRWGAVPVWLLPAPSLILVELWKSRDIIPPHLLATSVEVVAGFGVAVLAGVPLSILIVSSTVARKLTYPLLLVLQSVPKVALAPVILLWVGYGTGSKILIAAVTAFFPIIVNTTAGMDVVPLELLQLSRSLGSPRLKVFWKVRLPYAMPYVFSGMKVAMALSLIGAVVGEFVGSDKGLGYLILTFLSTNNTAMVFGGMALLSVFYAVCAAERIFCPWYVSSGNDRLV